MKTRAAVASLFVLAIVAALGRTVPDIIDRPLLRGAHGVREPIPLPATSGGDRLVQRTISLRTPDAADLATYEELRLVVGTYDTAPTLERGTLTVSGSCVFRAETERLRDNTTIRFHREAACGALSRAGADVALALIFTAASPRDARAALWTSPLVSGTAPLLQGQVEGNGFGLVGRAIAQRSPARVSIARLLAYMWDLPTWCIWLVVGAAGAIVIAGALALDRAAPAAAAFASFALATGIALLYSVVVPPLQAPDEPDHLLSFAQLTGRPALADETSSWAKRIHFYRMTFMADERFTPADREHSFALDWPAEVFAENVRHRSSTATRLWQALAPIVPARPPHALLILRLAASVVFGAAFAAGAALLTKAGHAAPAIPALVLLALPTLPFFGMHLSELPFTLCAFVLVGYAFLLMRHGAPGRVTGPLLGVAIALIAAGPRSGWPTLLVMGGVGGARMLGAAGGRTRPPGDTASFWGGLIVPAIALFGTRLLWIPSPFYEQWHLTTFDPRAGISSGALLLALTLGACTGAAGEWLLRRAPAVARALGPVARGLCAFGGLALIATFAWSAFAPLPMLPTVESTPPSSAPAYVQAVLLPLATAARVRQFDFLTWTSVWGGFGWADAILPPMAIAIVTVFALGMAAVTLIEDARDGEGRRALLTVCGVLGLAAAAAIAALSSYGLHRNMHGRYLLGGCIIGLGLLAVPALSGSGRTISLSARRSALLALCCGLHAFALTFLLEKYFG